MGGAGRIGRLGIGSAWLPLRTGALTWAVCSTGDPQAGSCSSPGQQHPVADVSPSRCLSLPLEWCAAALSWPSEGQLLHMVRLTRVNKRRFGKCSRWALVCHWGLEQHSGTGPLLGAFLTVGHSLGARA